MLHNCHKRLLRVSGTSECLLLRAACLLNASSNTWKAGDNQICSRLSRNTKGNCTQRRRNGVDARHGSGVSCGHDWCSRYPLNLLITHWSIAQSMCVRACRVIDYWRAYLDYHNQWLHPLAHISQGNDKSGAGDDSATNK